MSTVTTGDIETYYERRGDGQPVVFVHGAILDHAQWEPQVEALTAEYTTVAYDVRGHGRTGGSPRAAYSIDLFAEDLRATIRALDLDRPILVGHSMGGCIVQTYATRWPDELAGLVLADTFGPELFTRGEWLQRVLLLRGTVPPVQLVGYERVERAMVWLQRRVHGADVSGDYGRIEQLRAEGPGMTTDEFAKVIRAVSRFHEADVDLRTVDVPALVLYGEHEVGFVVRHAARFAAKLPDVTVEVVPDAGHASNLDDPGGFTGPLRAFLSGIRTADAVDAADGSRAM